MLQAINSLSDKNLATQDYILCAQLLQTDHEYLAYIQTSILSITKVQMPMYISKLCMIYCSCEFFDCMDREFLNWASLC